MKLDKAKLALMIEALTALLDKDQFDCPEDRTHALRFRREVSAEFNRRKN